MPFERGHRRRIQHGAAGAGLRRRCPDCLGDDGGKRRHAVGRCNALDPDLSQDRLVSARRLRDDPDDGHPLVVEAFHHLDIETS
ncbi:MAG: hypothetical protein H0V07_11185 [Propionibacteriales bacterium]|nr:hypothetical protein [Propionibacteriales bacterium]